MHQDNIDIICWNLCGFNARIDDLKMLIIRYSPIVLAVQELKTQQFKTPKLSGYKVITSLNSKAAIFIRDGYFFEEVDVGLDLEAVGIKLKLKTEVTIISLYLPPNEYFSLNNLNSLILNVSGKLIITGDVNARSTLWGSDRTDNRGKIIEKFCYQSNLFIANDGSHTHVPFQVNHNMSAIDVTMVSPSLAPVITWKTNDDPLGSDHIPLLISCNLKSPTFFIPSRYIFAKANWNQYAIDANLTDINLDNSSEKILEDITVTIQNAANINIPKTVSKNIKKNTPWFNKEIKSLINKRKHLYNKFKNNINKENLISYKQTKAKVTLEINKAKRTSWENYLKNLDGETTSKEFWKKIKSMEGKCSSQSPKYIKTNSNKIVNNLKDMTNELAKHFQEVSSSEEYCLHFRKIKESKDKKNIVAPSMKFESNINNPFSIDELKFSLKTTRSLAAGPDGIPYILIKKLSLRNLNQILKFFNKIWSTGIIPSAMKESLIIPLIKDANKESCTNNFRPISLLNCIAKILEKMVNHRLMWELENHNLIDPNQSGFRKNRSTITNLLILEDDLSNALRKRLTTTAVFFDIEKAYDKLWRQSIIEQLKKWGFGGNVFNFVKSFLINRTFCVTLGNEKSDQLLLENGIPQGSSLSVTLFLIGMEPLIRPLKKMKSIKYLVYADDLVVYSSRKNPDTSRKFIQRAIDKIFLSGLNFGFKFSESKSKSVIFSRKRRIHSINLKLGNKIIDKEKSVKFLGMIWDAKLNWREHIKVLKAKVKKRLNILSVLSHISWGASRHCLEKVLTSIILPTLDYGSSIYSSACKHSLKSLNPCLNVAIRKMNGAFITSPCESLYAESGIICLTDRRKLLDECLVIRLSSLINNPTSQIIFKDPPRIAKKNSFLDRTQEFIDNLKYLVIPQYKIDIAPWEFDKIIINTSMTQHMKIANDQTVCRLFAELLNTYSGYNHCYTDGSKTPDGVGFGVICSDYNISTKIHESESVYSAEAKAILQAIGICKIKNYKKNVIFTDSLSTIEAVKNRSNKSTLATYIRTSIIASAVDIILCWIPAHRGIRFNEEVDNLAKLATNLQFNENVVSMEDALREIKKTRYDEINNRWNNSTAKLRRVKPDCYKWTSSYRSLRREEVILTRLRIGHSRLTQEYLFKKEAVPLCECGSDLTIFHIFNECVKHKHLKDKFKLSTMEVDIGNNIKNNDAVLKFLKETGYFSKI